MLQHLLIKNFVTIVDQQVFFKPGFTVITGETGAGKSLLLKSILFCFGEKLPLTSLKDPSAPLSITAVYHPTPALRALLQDKGIELKDQEDLILRRQLTPDGKTRAFVNDAPVNMNLLKEIKDTLLSMHGQFDELMSPEAQVSLMDKADSLFDLKSAVLTAYQTWQKAVQEAQRLEQEIEALRKEKEFITSAAGELKQLAPEENEEDALLAQRQKLKDLSQSLDILKECHALFQTSEGLRETHYKITKKLTKLEDTSFTETLQTHLDQLLEHHQSIEDALENKLADLHDSGAYDIDQIESRLHALRAAARKYHCSANDLHVKALQFQEQAQLLDHSTHNLETIRTHVKETKAAYKEAAQVLTEARQKSGRKLIAAVLKELPSLKLDKMKLDLHVGLLPEDRWTSNGTHALYILVQPNIDAPYTPLHETASGGELSRLKLAFEKVTSHIKQYPIIIFDEIDKGVGGPVAYAVGQCLKSIGAHHQVIAISHSPQVAATADSHIKVDKSHMADKTISLVEVCDTLDKRREEIARMLSGADLTDQARAAANDLLQTP